MSSKLYWFILSCTKKEIPVKLVYPPFGFLERFVKYSERNIKKVILCAVNLGCVENNHFQLTMHMYKLDCFRLFLGSTENFLACQKAYFTLVLIMYCIFSGSCHCSG